MVFEISERNVEAEYEITRRYRRWWAKFLPNFELLVPEGAFYFRADDLMDGYFPPYTVNSRFFRDYSPAIQTILQDLRLILISQTSAILDPLVSREVFGPRALSYRGMDTSGVPIDIQLHQPCQLSKADGGLSDRQRFPKAYRPAYPLQSFEPRITFVPRLTSSPRNRNMERVIEEIDLQIDPNLIVPLLYEVEMRDAHAIACSVRAQMSLQSEELSYLIWDVGLFRPSRHDIENNLFAARCSAFGHLMQFGNSPFYQRPLNHPENTLMRDSCVYGSMLMLRAVIDQVHMQVIVLYQGFPVPHFGVDAEWDLFEDLHVSFQGHLDRLHKIVDDSTWRFAPTLGHGGIRVLDETDRPRFPEPRAPGVHYDDLQEDTWMYEYHHNYNRFHDPLPHPLGVEFSIPIGAPVPNRINGVIIPISFQSTSDTAKAWIADQIEDYLTALDFNTLFRSFRVSEGSLVVKLILIDTHATPYHPGLSPLFRHLWEKRELFPHQQVPPVQALASVTRLIPPIIEFGSDVWPVFFPIDESPPDQVDPLELDPFEGLDLSDDFETDESWTEDDVYTEHEPDPDYDDPMDISYE